MTSVCEQLRELWRKPAEAGEPLAPVGLGRDALSAFEESPGLDPKLRTWLTGEVPRVIAETVDRITAAMTTMTAEGHCEVVVKGRMACNGRDSRRLPLGAPLSKGNLSWLAGLLERHGRVIVEPWLDRVADLSLLVDATRAHQGLTWFLADHKGRYRGAVLGRRKAIGGFEAHSWLARAGFWDGGQAALATALKEFLRNSGYQGPAGLDLYLFRHRGELRLRASEINPRYTMGHIALALEPRVIGDAGLWLHLSEQDAKREGFPGLPSYAAAIAAIHPAQISDGQGLRAGALFTNDPRTARVRLGVLLAGSSAWIDKVRTTLFEGGLRLLEPPCP